MAKSTATYCAGRRSFEQNARPCRSCPRQGRSARRRVRPRARSLRAAREDRRFVARQRVLGQFADRLEQSRPERVVEVLRRDRRRDRLRDPLSVRQRDRPLPGSTSKKRTRDGEASAAAMPESRTGSESPVVTAVPHRVQACRGEATPAAPASDLAATEAHAFFAQTRRAIQRVQWPGRVQSTVVGDQSPHGPARLAQLREVFQPPLRPGS